MKIKSENLLVFLSLLLWHLDMFSHFQGISKYKTFVEGKVGGLPL